MLKPILFMHTWQPCHDSGANDTCRGTFLYTWGHFLAHRFVFDNTRKWENLLHDEIRVEVDPGLQNTSLKTHQAIEWAYLEGYDAVCYAPIDCYFIVPRLLRNLDEHLNAGHHYWGFHTYDEHHIGGGSAYWLSKRAMEAVIEGEPYPDYEDRWIGTVCRDALIPAIHDERYRSIEQPYRPDVVSMHLSLGTGNYDPENMKNLHLRVIQGASYHTEEPNL